MKARQHPEYSEEATRLQATIVALRNCIDEIGKTEPKGGDAFATEALYKHYRQRYGYLQQSLSSPYFGRVDFLPDDIGIVETHYIGKAGFEHNGQQVIDWKAPIAKLFYLGKPGRVSYDSLDDDSKIDGQMLLKRNLGIENGILTTIADEFDIRTQKDLIVHPIVDPDEYLRSILASKRDIYLKEIVATIQAQQYELIRAKADQVLVIQGVAGSGKTSIALHRLAYLLYPGNASGIEAKRCIILGPNQLFMNYVSQVLPGLGVEGIPQTTFDAWMCSQVGLNPQNVVDTVLDRLLSDDKPRNEKVLLYRSSQLKTCRRMGQLLRKYTEHWRRRTSFPEAMVYSTTDPLKVTLRISRAEINEAYATSQQLPVNRHRERFLEALRRRLAGQYDEGVKQRAKELSQSGEKLLAGEKRLQGEASQLEKSYADFAQKTGDAKLQDDETVKSLQQGAKGLRELADYCHRRGEQITLSVQSQLEDALEEKTRRRTLERVATQLAKDIEQYWPSLNPVAGYYSLLADRDLLIELGNSLFSTDEIDVLHKMRPSNTSQLETSDLPGICFLNTVANGIPVALFDHIIIDEAQDVCPLQFEILGQFSRNNSYTILGDLAQGICSYRGISNWLDVKDVLPERHHYEEIKKSYRSTYEITLFANEILRALPSKHRDAIIAEPFERHGSQPVVRSLKNAADLPKAIVQAINQIQQKGYKDIAIITKTNEQCSQLSNQLNQIGFDKHCAITSTNFEYTSGVMVLPIHLAKGMEFEVVIIANASTSTYWT